MSVTVTEATCLVKTESCYAAVFDTASPAYMKGLLTSELAQAAARGTPHEYPKGWQFRFDARLSQRAAAGELLAWLLLFDGVFKAQLSVVPTIPEPSAVRTNDNSGYGDSVADLLFNRSDGVLMRLLLLNQIQEGLGGVG